jgi:hypothetical protein
MKEKFSSSTETQRATHACSRKEVSHMAAKKKAAKKPAKKAAKKKKR